MLIDLSVFNTVTSWDLLQANVEGIILRIGYRGYGALGTIAKDKNFDKYYKECVARKIPHSVYFMSQAKTSAEAIAEAQWVLKQLNGARVSYPIYFDSEYGNKKHTGRADKLTKAERTACAVAFCDCLIANGYEAGIYASESWFINNLSFASVRNYSTWVAKYPLNDVGEKIPTINLAKWDYHQYTSHKLLAGLSDRCDASIKNSVTNTVIQEEKYNMPTIKKGSQGTAVKILQAILGITIDGKFGAATQAALKKYQKAHGLTVDGVCGTQTWTYALNHCAA